MIYALEFVAFNFALLRLGRTARHVDSTLLFHFDSLNTSFILSEYTTVVHPTKDGPNLADVVKQLYTSFTLRSIYYSYYSSIV